MFFAFALGDFLAGFSHITFMIPVKRNKLKKKPHIMQNTLRSSLQISMSALSTV